MTRILSHAERRRALFDVKTLIQMDGAEHREYRKVTNDWFKPANLRRTVEAGLRPLARHFVDRMLERDGECDFAGDIALYYPLRVIMQILGVPERMPIRYRLRPASRNGR